jgi:TrwC relaxase
LLAPTVAGEGSGGVVADIAKLSVGREAYYTRELATDHEQYLSGHGESRGRWYGAGAREDDPLVHTHLVVANRVQGPDGRWTALDGRDLYRHRLAADTVYGPLTSASSPGHWE